MPNHRCSPLHYRNRIRSVDEYRQSATLTRTSRSSRPAAGWHLRERSGRLVGEALPNRRRLRLNGRGPPLHHAGFAVTARKAPRIPDSTRAPMGFVRGRQPRRLVTVVDPRTGSDQVRPHRRRRADRPGPADVANTSCSPNPAACPDFSSQTHLCASASPTSTSVWSSRSSRTNQKSRTPTSTAARVWRLQLVLTAADRTRIVIRTYERLCSYAYDLDHPAGRMETIT